MKIEDIARIKIPNASFQVLLRMAKTMARDTPEQANEPVKAALLELLAQISRIDDALPARVRSKNPRIIARELEFDRAVDSLWVFFRRFLELCVQAFGHPGLDQLTPERQAQVQLTKLREIAAMARSLHEQLFEAEGTNFTRSAFASQAESMAAIFRIIKADQLDAGIDAVLNDLILPALMACQQQYEELTPAQAAPSRSTPTKPRTPGP